MPATPDLWGYIQPITTWVTLSAVESGEDTERTVSLRVQRGRARSVTVTARVDVYCSEAQLLRACSEVLDVLEKDQDPLTHNRILTLLDQQIGNWVTPF